MGQVSDLYSRKVAAGLLRADPAQQQVLPHMDHVLDQMQAAPAPKRSAWRAFLGVGSPDPAPAAKGLYLWGGVGRGKSMLMDLMAEAAGDIPCRRVHFHEFMQEIQAGLNEARKRGQQDTVRPVAESVARQTRLLCFDEMQITDIADAMIVGRLFQVLFDQGVTVVTTSNRVPEDLYKHGLNRQLFLPFIGLIRERMEVVCLDSQTDYRQNRQGGPVWFAPADAQAKAALDGVWSDLTGDATPEPLTIAVQGRKVTLPAHAGRVARSGFWDLCGRPLGAADYLAVARAVDVLLIDGVPRLSASNYNEARRFVTLIDALYEAKVRLIASAADEPEQLYNEGEGSFEFERTASRLREMQDAAWGRRADASPETADPTPEAARSGTA
ncbi:cell division protein ZapE [Paracoccus gahaiensis]|uniref:Cell division protein ZapE n=1 Tax=Paracoccus gahaiensis TaxID=1706839 RepID=A0A4U0RDA0_9RHOB|nr:cell division protein ZapE [Paracoccus gahaiensis]TJZ93351.1 cell division protein ZapE [Paracoccus gahaiensis]